MKTKVFSLMKSKAALHVAPGQKILPASALTDLLSVEEAMEKMQEDADNFRKEQVKEVELAREQAQREGFEAGFQKWTQKIAELEQEIARTNESMEDKLAPVALQAAKKIVGKELEMNPNAIAAIVKNALQSVRQHKQILVYVNPQELESVFEQREDLQQIFERLESLTIRARDDISRGSCVIETEGGIINAKLENQWKILEQVFDQLMGKKAAKEPEETPTAAEDNQDLQSVDDEDFDDDDFDDDEDFDDDDFFDDEDEF